MIKIVKGTFGLWDGLKVVPMTAKDGAFEVSEEQELRLVRLGVAEHVDGEQAPEYDAAMGTDDPDGGPALEEMKMDQLKERAEKVGIKFKVGTKKADFIEQIRAEEAKDGPTEAEAEEYAVEPDTFDDGEQAPEYDAAGAVV